MYPYRIRKDTPGYMVTFRDIPEAVTAGTTRDEARAHATDALMTALEFYFDAREPIPAPSSRRPGEETAALPTIVAAKIELHNALLARGLRRAAFAREINANPSDVDRLLDIRHVSKIGAIDAALSALGRRIVLRTVQG